MFKCSNVPILICSNFQIFKYSNAYARLQVEVGEGEEAVLECGVQGLASIHMVGSISQYFFYISIQGLMVIIVFLKSFGKFLLIVHNNSPDFEKYFSTYFCNVLLDVEQILFHMIFGWIGQHTFTT